MKNNYFVYGYFHPNIFMDSHYSDISIKNVPFYIGKGCKNRHLQHLYKSHNDFLSLCIKKLEENNTFPIIKKLYLNLNENDAFDIESDIIDHYGVVFEDGVLFNKLIPSKKIVYSTQNFIEEKTKNIFDFYYSVIYNMFSDNKIPNVKIIDIYETVEHMKLGFSEYILNSKNSILTNNEPEIEKDIKKRHSQLEINRLNYLFKNLIGNNSIKENIIRNIKIHGISIDEMAKILKCDKSFIEEIL